MSKIYKYPSFVKSYALSPGGTVVVPYEDLEPTDSFGALLAVITAGTEEERLVDVSLSEGQYKRVGSAGGTSSPYRLYHAYIAVDPGQAGEMEVSASTSLVCGFVAVMKLSKEYWQALLAGTEGYGKYTYNLFYPQDPGQYEIPHFFGHEIGGHYCFSVFGQTAADQLDILDFDGNSSYEKAVDADEANYEFGCHTFLARDELGQRVAYIKYTNAMEWIWGTLWWAWKEEESGEPEPPPPPPEYIGRRVFLLSL